MSATIFNSLSETAISAAMSAPIRRKLHTIEVHQQVSSTNDRIWALLQSGINTPVACLAEQQTAGRGRRGKQWQSPASGNLYLSLYWPFAANRPPRGLSIAVGICLVQTLNAFGINNLQLKWPNDVLCNGHKLAGILIESRYNSLYNTVIGIGLNFRLPPSVHRELDQPAISLEQLCAQPPCRNQLAGHLIQNMINAAESFQDNALNDFLPGWQALDVLYGQNIEISSEHETFSAIAQGINADGELQYLYKGQLMSLSNSHHSIRLSP